MINSHSRGIAPGIYPTMITPFTATDKVDYKALEQLVEWYIRQGANGLFAVCQSSEMFFLTLEERAEIARFVREQAAGRVSVVASGHISEELSEQIRELEAVAATGVDAVVLVSNRLARQDEPDEVWMENAAKLLEAVPDISFGVYECPFPYKRLLSPELLAWCQSTGRFRFLKDTCCNTSEIAARLAAVKGGGLGLFNANTATLLESLQLGAQGYSGVMANFHPDLYAWLYAHYEDRAPEALRLQQFLSVASVIENQFYPVNAKYYLSLEGLPVETYSRTKDHRQLTFSQRRELEHLFALTSSWREQFI